MEKTPVGDYKSDSDGLDLNRQTITGDNDTYFKVLIEQVEGRYLSDEEYFPRYVKAHIDRGRQLLLDMSPIDEEVRDAMLPYLSEEFGNPSSKYYCKATNAKAAVEEAREKVAKLIGAKPEEIIFTAGATESTNFIIKGYLDYRKYYGDG